MAVTLLAFLGAMPMPLLEGQHVSRTCPVYQRSGRQLLETHLLQKGSLVEPGSTVERGNKGSSILIAEPEEW